MELLLKRKTYTDQSTAGELSIDGSRHCFTLEDVCRDKNHDGDLADAGETKVHGKTAIPSGRYRVILSFSNRFKKVMPEVLLVNGFAGIRIHSGNTAEDSEGCILVGKTQQRNLVGDSRLAYVELMARLAGTVNSDKIFLTIQD